MSKWEITISLALVALMAIVVGESYRTDALKSRIQALEQSQCVMKQEKMHAEVKFAACMDQLKR